MIKNSITCVSFYIMVQNYPLFLSHKVILCKKCHVKLSFVRYVTLITRSAVVPFHWLLLFDHIWELKT